LPSQRRLFARLPKPDDIGGIAVGKTGRRNDNPEFREQASLFAWAELAAGRHPELRLLHASAAGEKRDRATAIKCLRMGVKPGFPDVHLPIARGVWHSLYIEMKAPGAPGATDKQLDVHELLQLQGNRVEVCHSWVTAKDLLLAYLAAPRPDLCHSILGD
jgi:hypothetical protein